MRLRAFALGLLTLSILVVAAPARAGPPDVCGDHNISLGQIQVMSGSICHEGAVYVCEPKNHQGDWKCTPISWCTFCPGPVLF